LQRKLESDAQLSGFCSLFGPLSDHPDAAAKFEARGASPLMRERRKLTRIWCTTIALHARYESGRKCWNWRR